MQENYSFTEIEAIWQQKWAENNVFKCVDDPDRKRFYCLEMYPYPSDSTNVYTSKYLK